MAVRWEFEVDGNDMPLKYKLKSKEEVPAELANFYAERDGSFVLDLEGAVEKSKLDEFRNNNVTLQKQLSEFQQKYEGIDVEKARELLRKQEELEDAKLVKQGDVDKVVEKRVQGLKTELEMEKTSRETAERLLANITIDEAALAAATRRGIRASAVMDLKHRVRTVFKLVNGKATAFEADGTTIRYSRDGVTPLTLDEWVDGLVAEAPHLFEPSSGGGASSSGSGGAGLIGHGQKNPWKRETWNFTEQCRLVKENPTLASQLKKAAGR